MMRMLAILTALMLFAFTNGAFGQAPSPRFVEARGNGVGVSPEEAVRTALLTAIRSVNGAAITMDPKHRQPFEDSLRDLQVALSAPEVSVESMQEEIATLSRGFVERLRVLDQRPRPEGAFEATITASVALFETRLASRKSVAVTLFRPSRDEFRFGAVTMPSAEFARTLGDVTTERLVRSNALTVLDRSFIEEIGREKNFLELHSRDSDELARFGRMLGADYLLVGSLEFAGLDVINHVVEASGYSFSQANAGMEVSARLIDTATGRIAWAERIRTGFGNSELTRMFSGAELDSGAVAGALVDRVAEDLAGAVVESIAPIKVALAEGDAVWLNRGSGRLRIGDRLMIRGGGREILDPDTGEPLGPAERTVAVVEVVAIDTRKCQCRVLEGDPAAITIGQTARAIARP